MSLNLPPQKRGQIRSYYFKASRPDEGLVKIMGPYPSANYAIAVRETMRSAGYQVGTIAND